MKLILTACAGLMLGGCATVTRGTTNDIQMTSEPSGALAVTSLSQQCTTPCGIKVSRKDEFSVVFSKPGYSDLTIGVKTQVAGSGAAGFAGNLILGGVVGMGVDAATGSTLEHVPNPVHGVLTRIGPPPRILRSPRGKPAPARPPLPEPEETDAPAT